jgi:acyl-CoA reductase-like NAD-dependent aldehyde dehydrogenase
VAPETADVASEPTRVLIDGAWEDARATLPVVNPWSGDVLAQMAVADADQLDRALAGAVAARGRPAPAAERAAVLDRAAAALAGDAEPLARTIAADAAKPLRTARAEVARAVQTLLFSAAEARTLGGRGVPMDAHPAGTGTIGFTVRRPRGVVAAITPFNFPLNLVAHKVGPAVAAGCPVVLKPAERAPLAALSLAAALLDAGLPAGFLQVVTGDGATGAALAADPRPAVVSFTGSAAVGRLLQRAAEGRRVLLELGSAAPLIIERDGDVTAAAAAIALHGYSHAGQSCVSVQRVLVHADRADELRAALVPAVAALRVGDPLDERTDVSALISHDAAERVASWIGAAEEAGASVLVGGERRGGVVAPAVVTGVGTDTQLWREEVFGPVVAVRTFAETAEAVDAANLGPEPGRSAGGLNAAVYTADLDTALRYAGALDYGTVLVNEAPTFRVDQMPYGADGAGGNTREGPAAVVRELTDERLVVLRSGS